MDKISVCITTFNRLEFTLRSFAEIYNDERVGEIVISDDCSDMDCYLQMIAAVAEMDKVKLIRNEVNLGCYFNKLKAIENSSYDYCILFDSDNELNTSYIDAIYRYNWIPTVILAPDYLMPVFDYTHFAGHVITRENVSTYAQQKAFDCLINSMNYFVNRDEFIRVFDKETKRFADDSAYINYKWLEAGNKIFVAPFMRYMHTIHSGSHYQQFAMESQARFDELMNKFKNGF